MKEHQQAEPAPAQPRQEAADGKGPASAAGGTAGVPDLRQVTRVETLKALADPIRLAILSVLMKADGEQPVMSVKELAEQLSEPQTKLYRHVKALESAGLINVAATRLVSGILEQRYQASQRDIMLGPGLLRDADTETSEAVIANVLRQYSQMFFAAFREGRIPEGDFPADQLYRKAVMLMSEKRVSAQRAVAIRNKLQEVLAELDSPGDPDGVPVNVLIGFYSPLDDGPA